MQENFIVIPMKKGSKNPHVPPSGNVVVHGIIQKEGQNILYTHFPALCGSYPKETSIGWTRGNKDISCDVCRRQADKIYLQLKANREGKNNAKDGSQEESR